MPSLFFAPSSDTRSAFAALIARLQNAGLPTHCSVPVAQLLQASGLISEGEEDLSTGVELLAQRLAERLLPLDGQPLPGILLRGACTVATSLQGGHFPTLESPANLLGRLVEHLKAECTDLTDPLRALAQRVEGSAAEFRRSRLATGLLVAGALDLARLLSPDKVRALASTNTRSKSPGLEPPDEPAYWIEQCPAQTVEALHHLLERQPIATLGELAMGVERALSLRYPAGAQFIPHVPAMAQLLRDRRVAEQAEHDRLLTRCCWVWSRIGHEQAGATLDEPRLAQLALEELGRMRSLMREPPEQFDDQQREYLEAALDFAIDTDIGKLWPALKRLFLALREVPHPAVPRDLRTWDEHGLDPLPQPWSWVPAQTSRVLDRYLGRALKTDTRLENLRQQVAEFCLDRLRTREKGQGDGLLQDDDFTEPSAIWREGYLHALQELAVNPGGRGHRFLDWLEDHEPNPDVRKVGKQVRKALRRSHGLPQDASARRPLYAAFWWLRLAHLLHLGVVPDQDGARRTHEKEVRRAKDLDLASSMQSPS